jgi:hypothetical protein
MNDIYYHDQLNKYYNNIEYILYKKLNKDIIKLIINFIDIRHKCVYCNSIYQNNFNNEYYYYYCSYCLSSIYYI